MGPISIRGLDVLQTQSGHGNDAAEKRQWNPRWKANIVELRDEARRQIWGLSHGETEATGRILCTDSLQPSRSLEGASFSL